MSRPVQDDDRIVVWFSCGAASAVALKVAVEAYGAHRVRAVNSPVAEEDEDNRRFLRDVEAWAGVGIETATNLEYDHILADWLGGEPTLENCAVLCTACHRGEGGKTAEDARVIARAKRVHRSHIGAAPKTRNPLPGSRASAWKRTLDGRTVRRFEE